MRSATLRSSDKLSASAIVTTGRGLLGALAISPGTATTTITIYDNTAASGKVLFEGVYAANGDSVFIDIPDAVVAESGIYASITGTGASCVVYTG